MRAELAELRRFLRHYELPHTLVSAMAAVSFLGGFGLFAGRSLPVLVALIAQVSK